MLQKQEETTREVRALRQDLREITDQRLARVERDIAEIRARVGLGPAFPSER